MEVKTRVKGGRSHEGLTKIRLATIVSLKATSRRIVGNGKRKMQMMMGLGTQLVMPMLVT